MKNMQMTLDKLATEIKQGIFGRPIQTVSKGDKKLIK